jgi:hypothetical protein
MPQVIDVSAKLKTGQNLKSIKSITYPTRNLSIKLLIAPANIIEYADLIRIFRMEVLNINIKMRIIATKLIYTKKLLLPANRPKAVPVLYTSRISHMPQSI